MLDNGTKQRIDTARNILVGKIPDPKSQVEQITIALIYKFMDDMDQESLALGGTASFFVGEYEKYGWSSMFDPRLGGYDMLALYSEALTRMSENPHLPQLFRDIFKNAYLPYRDPETLKLFLKTINEFYYDHSERLGDAFEYLLSVLGSQGDAGQFRTPRHIIEFMVAVVDPKKHETILDPACGTAGFLISAYKHIRQNNTRKEPGDLLSMQDRTRMIDNFTGYDISPDMVRLSLVNMYLHGFVTPQIYEYDTLSSEDRWHEYADVILANPPFMSPSGGIRPHKRFSVQSKRSEVLFVDYMAEHLTPNGRAAIIVPEGIIFQSGIAYKQLRKYLIEKNFLWAVVSLPSGVFNPYAGVKTSILFLDKVVARKTDRVLFVKVQNDGFDLGVQRRTIEKNDLPAAQRLMQAWQQAVVEKGGEGFDLSQHPEIGALLVEKSRLAENGEYNLSVERYREIKGLKNKQWEFVELEKVVIFNPKKSEVSSYPDDLEVTFLPMEDLNENRKYFEPNKIRMIGEIYKGYTYFSENDVLLAKVTPCFENGKSGIAKNLKNKIGFGSSEYFVLRAQEKILPEFLYLFISENKFKEMGKLSMTGTGGLQRVSPDFVKKYRIPLPPREVQREIVSEIEGYQRIIDGARMVVENWKPNIELELEEARKEAGVEEWEEVDLSEFCGFIRGPFGGSLKKEIFVKEGYLVYEQNHAINNDFNFGRYYINEKKYQEMKRFEVFSGDLLISCSGTMGRIAIVPNIHKKGIINQALLKLTPHSNINTLFLKYYLESNDIQNKYFSNQQGVAIQNVASVKVMKSIKIPNLPLEIQNAIIEKIESEKRIVESSKELIEIYQKKIQKLINNVWDG
jgi:type I restriction enzyme M protein